MEVKTVCEERDKVRAKFQKIADIVPTFCSVEVVFFVKKSVDSFR